MTFKTVEATGYSERTVRRIVSDISGTAFISLAKCYKVYHKGAIAPLYIGMVRVGQHRSHTFGKPRFRGNRYSIRNPSSRKGTYGQNMGVLKK